jgi:hypothetical protein
VSGCHPAVHEWTDATATAHLCSNSAVRSLPRVRRSPARSVLHAAHRLLLGAKRPFGRRLCHRCGWLAEAPGASVRRGVARPNSTRPRRPPGFPLRSCSLPYSPLTGPSSAGRGDAAVLLGTGGRLTRGPRRWQACRALEAGRPGYEVVPAMPKTAGASSGTAPTVSPEVTCRSRCGVDAVSPPNSRQRRRRRASHDLGRGH